MIFNWDSALGIEIQGSRMALASVKRGFQDFRYGSHLVIDSFQELPTAELKKRIQEFVKESGVNRENVIVGLPREAVIVRQVELPLEVEENLDQVVRFQVDRFEPSEDELSFFDYQLLKKNPDAGSLSIQIVMVRQEVMDRTLQLFRECGLFPASVCYASLGIAYSLRLRERKGPRDKAAAIFYCRPDAVEFVLLAGERRIFSEVYPAEVMNGGGERLLDEFGLFVQRLDLGADELDRVYVTGPAGEGCLAAIQERVPEAVDLESEIRQAQKGLSRTALSETLAAAGLAVSGLLMSPSQGLNLIPSERRVIRERPSLVPSFILAGLLLFLLGAMGTRDYVQKQSLQEEVQRHVQLLEGDVQSVLELRSQVQQRQAELEELQGLLSGRQTVLLILKDLTERIPEDTYLQTFQVQNDQIQMQGYSRAASNLLQVLVQSPYIENVKPNWITEDRSVPDMQRFNFAATVKKR